MKDNECVQRFFTGLVSFIQKILNKKRRHDMAYLFLTAMNIQHLLLAIAKLNAASDTLSLIAANLKMDYTFKKNGA